ncbi:ParB/RepB/Spo0J family partition protein [Lentzea xinjiangensis]|uniref:ParB/RepB/Spo0J family partition protein n=1 Tax=Lentzea xinjiangensis TaxID=402600 RepID=UPI0015A7321A|nr:ParB N-terminal domain-containing protein [Lentzea xinjiangensis]
MRTEEESTEHVHMLAVLGETTPPITVHRATMRVIDGLHRVRAALLRGRESIEVVFFTGDERDAFLLAVELNAKHGLPLSRADRVAAATRIVASHPDWSDRAIAALTGVGASTVSAVRRRVTAGVTQPPPRLGKDGRVRPLSTAEGRVFAGRLFQERPEASLREVAREAGISVGTARDVRLRLASGEHPVPPRQRSPVSREVEVPAPRTEATALALPADFHDAVRALTRDPAFRLSEKGREVLRLLDAHSRISADWCALVDSVPAHARAVVADMARMCAHSWSAFAEVVQQREQASGR